MGNPLKYTYILETNTHIDLSSNALTGAMPTDIGSLVGLKYLYLSKNGVTGSIPSTVENLLQLEQIDLSIDRFNGTIPSSLRNLSFLSYFNVSWNNLNAPIPTNGHQFATFMKRSLYLPGNDSLCGSVIDRSCSSIPTNSSSTTSQETYAVKDNTSLAGSLLDLESGFASSCHLLSSIWIEQGES